jgi:hypothetical protein
MFSLSTFFFLTFSGVSAIPFFFSPRIKAQGGSSVFTFRFAVFGYLPFMFLFRSRDAAGGPNESTVWTAWMSESGQHDRMVWGLGVMSVMLIFEYQNESTYDGFLYLQFKWTSFGL